MIGCVVTAGNTKKHFVDGGMYVVAIDCSNVGQCWKGAGQSAEMP